MSDYVVFLDAANLCKRGQKELGWEGENVRINAEKFVQFSKKLKEIGANTEIWENATFSGVYWYDGAFPPGHAMYQKQRRAFAAIAATNGVTVRTGKVVERPYPGRARTRDTLRETLRFFRLDEEPILEKFDELWELYPVRQQKGVDTLIISDMLMGAVDQEFNTVVLVSGDSDLADPFRTVKSLGCKTVLVVPAETGLAPELKRIADETIRIPYNELRRILYRRQKSKR